MKHPYGTNTEHEAVGIFFDREHLHSAVDDLLASGFQPADIGLLAGEHTVRQHLGDIYREIGESADLSDRPQLAFVAENSIGDTMRAIFGSLFFVGSAVGSGMIVASAAVLGGGLLAAAGGAIAVGGIGAMLAKLIRESEAEYLEEQLDEGHMLLFVRIGRFEQEKAALDILSQHGAFDARIHRLPAVGTSAA